VRACCAVLIDYLTEQLLCIIQCYRILDFYLYNLYLCGNWRLNYFSVGVEAEQSTLY